jgi:hypothetical protein
VETHTLLTDEVVDLSKLTAKERGYIRRLTRDAGEGVDYFDLLRRVKGPKALPLRGGPITPAIAASVFYRVAHDIADRIGIEQGYLLAPRAPEPTHADRRTDLLSLTEAARLIGITRPAAHQAVTEARLPGRRVGNAWIITRQDAETYRRAREHRVADDNPNLQSSRTPASIGAAAEAGRRGTVGHRGKGPRGGGNQTHAVSFDLAVRGGSTRRHLSHRLTSKVR